MFHQRRNVFPPFPERRNDDGNDVQTVEQVLLEPAVGHHLQQIPVGGGDHADVDLFGPFRPQRFDLALLQHPQQLRLQRRAHGPDLVQKDRAAVGQRELALLRRRRAGKRAAHVAEELRLQQRFGDRRAIHLDERHVALRTTVVNRTRDELLAGAGFAGNEDRALALGDELRAADHVLHRLAAPDDAVVVELLVALADEIPVLAAQTLMVEGAAHHDQQLVDLERLLQVVERAELHRLDGALHRGVRRHHQNLGPFVLRRRPHELADEIQTGDLRHHVVHEEHVEGAFAEQPLRLTGTRRLRHLVPGVAQRAAEGPEDLFLIVDEQNGSAMHSHEGPGAEATRGLTAAEASSGRSI